MTQAFFKMQAAALAATLLFAASAAQAKTWVLSTGEADPKYRDAVYDAFAAASGGAANVVDGRTQLAAGNATPLALPADVNVIAVGVLGAHEPARVDEVLALLANPPRELTVVFFSDGAAANNTDPRPSSSGEVVNKKILDAMNAQLGLDGGDALGINYAGPGGRYYLNTNSPFAQGFPGSLSGGDYDAYTNVPGAYTLYMAGNAANTKPPMPGATEKVEAYGLFAPRAAMQNKQTCVFAFGDISPFAGGAAAPQITGLAQRIMHMATDPAGACQSKAVGTPDLVPTTITLPASMKVGGTGTIDVRIANNGLAASTGGTATIILPPGIELAGPLPGSCTHAPGTSNVDCTLSAIAPGASVDLALPIRIATAGKFIAYVGIAVDGKTGELPLQTLNNNRQSDELTVPAPQATVTGPATATANAATTVTGEVSSLADGAQVDVEVNGTTVSATVTGGQFTASFPAGFPVGQHAVTVTGPNGLTQAAPYTIDVTAAALPGQVTAVPTLDVWGLGALAALLGAAGLRRQRKGARQG